MFLNLVNNYELRLKDCDPEGIKFKACTRGSHCVNRIRFSFAHLLF